jgi:hypothetical protein
MDGAPPRGRQVDMANPREPLTRQQRFGLRVVFCAGSLLALMSIASLIVLWSGSTTRSPVLDAVQLVCGGLMAGVSGRRLRAARTR